MDEESHAQVLQAMFQTLQNKTVIVVSHSLRDVEKFDKVLVWQMEILLSVESQESF